MNGQEIPQELIDKSEQTRNAKILINLNKGLKERGYPLYEEDYDK